MMISRAALQQSSVCGRTSPRCVTPASRPPRAALHTAPQQQPCPTSNSSSRVSCSATPPDRQPEADSTPALPSKSASMVKVSGIALINACKIATIACIGAFAYTFGFQTLRPWCVCCTASIHRPHTALRKRQRPQTPQMQPVAQTGTRTNRRPSQTQNPTPGSIYRSTAPTSCGGSCTSACRPPGVPPSFPPATCRCWGCCLSSWLWALVSGLVAAAAVLVWLFAGGPVGFAPCPWSAL